jgi:hypothetical protein
VRWENPERPGQVVNLSSLFASLNAARAKEFVPATDPEAQKALAAPDLTLDIAPKPETEQEPLTLSLSSAGLRAYARSSRQPDIAVLDLSTFNSIETEVKRLLEGERGRGRNACSHRFALGWRGSHLVCWGWDPFFRVSPWMVRTEQGARWST